MDSESFKQEAADWFADHCRNFFLERYKDAVGKCESEIERIFLAALNGRLHEVDVFRFMPTIGGWSVEKARTLAPWMAGYPTYGCVTVHPQTTIGAYRVDFFIHFLGDSGADIGIVVECDGHDYHERTKKQAERDRKRDRELQALGYHVLRFTGSEICRDPYACADEIGDLYSKFIQNEIKLTKRDRAWVSKGADK